MESLRSIDDALSKPLMYARGLPAGIEWLFAYPACFFGVPGVIGGPLLASAGCCAALQHNARAIPRVFMLWSVLLWFTYIILFRIIVGGIAEDARLGTKEGEKRKNGNLASARSLFDFFVPIPIISFGLAHFYYHEAIEPMQAFSFSTLGCQILVVLLKRWSQRTRPCMRPIGGTSNCKLPAPLPARTAPLSLFVSTTKYAKESFPSGDAAEAAIFASVAVHFGASDSSSNKGPHTGSVITFAIGCIILAAMGRVYFHCHHTGDVTAGVAIGIASSMIMKRMLPGEVAWYVPAVSTVSFLLIEKGIRRIQMRRHKEQKSTKAK